MKSNINLDTTADEKSFSVALVIGLILVLVASVASIYMFFQFGQVAPSQIGQIGEYFGGWLTPLLLAFMVLLLIFSLRFQIHELRMARASIAESALVHRKVAESQEQLLSKTHINFEMESSAKGLINLVEQSDEILRTKVNVYVDIINFDNKLPHETRLLNVIDSWNLDLEHGKIFDMKCRQSRDQKLINKYLHNIHHEIYICQTLAKNSGWSYISPYVKSMVEHIEALVTLHKVSLVSDKEIWLVKQAVLSLYDKLSHIKGGEIVVGSDIIARLIKDRFDELIEFIPTPPSLAEQANSDLTKTDEQGFAGDLKKDNLF